MMVIELLLSVFASGTTHLSSYNYTKFIIEFPQPFHFSINNTLEETAWEKKQQIVLYKRW